MKINMKKVIAAVTMLLIVALAGLLLWNVVHGPDKLEKSVRAELGQLEGKTNDEIIEALNRVVEEGNLNISINTNPVFAHGAALGTLRIENSPANRYDQVVAIVRDDTGEEIYNSGLLPPNYHIQEDVLSVVLEAGDYPCTVTFTAYDAEQNVVGAANAKVVITVLA